MSESPRKRVLFVTYYWPPSGKASLHWPIRMIQHLRTLGWQPSVLTAEEDTFSERDESLLSSVDPSLRVQKAPSWEPFNLYRSFLGKDRKQPLVASETISKSEGGLRHRIAVWVRMNLFIPDARVGWLWSAVKRGRQFLQGNPVDCIVSIGPPHTAHLVGRKLARAFHLPFVPVFIDPWVDIAYYKGFNRSALTRYVDRRLERSVLDDAASVVFVTESMKEGYGRRSPSLASKSHVLYWGYDEDPFRDFQPAPVQDCEILLHTGNLFDFQNPRGLWTSLRKELDGGRKLRIVFVGTVSPGIRRSIDDAGLSQHTDIKGFLPYEHMVKELAGATYLLVCATEKRHVPGKLFEYLRTGKPVIAFGDDNQEVEGILKECRAGILLPYQYSGTDLFRRLEAIRPNPQAAKRFERRVIAEELSHILDALF